MSKCQNKMEFMKVSVNISENSVDEQKLGVSTFE